MKKSWTGERLETFIQTENTTEHLHRYAIAKAISSNIDVVDIACGEGYGSNLLAASAKSITGIDISIDTINAAKAKYKKQNLQFIAGSASKIPVADNSVDLVISFETIEHHDEHEKMLLEIKRILKPGGVLLMSSPDKKNYSDIPNYKNPYHVKELYFDQYKSLIKSHFSNAEFFFQKIIAGSLIIHENEPRQFTGYYGSYDVIFQEQDFLPVYNLSISSDGHLPYVPNSLFNGSAVNKMILEEAVNAVKQSWRYKIGEALLSPLKLFKK